MTASESLFIQTDLDPKALLMRLLPIKDEDIEQIVMGTSRSYRATGTWYANADWDVHEDPTEIFGKTHAEHFFDFRETLCLVVTPPNEKDRKAVQDLLITEVLKLIKTTPYNLALEFHDGIHVLKRVDGKLTLFYHSDRIVWTPERLSMIDIPYEMKSWTFQ